MPELIFSPHQLPWIEHGYRVFAYIGPAGLRVEELAREVGISKSSFYHHFADMEVFVSYLLRYHHERGRMLASDAAACEHFDPDFVRLLLRHKDDIFFNRMLRVHHDNIDFQICYQSSHLQVERAILPIWSEWLGVEAGEDYARSIFTVITDLFYQRLSADQYSYEWITDLLAQIRQLIREISSRNEVLFSAHQ